MLSERQVESGTFAVIFPGQFKSFPFTFIKNTFINIYRTVCFSIALLYDSSLSLLFLFLLLLLRLCWLMRPQYQVFAFVTYHHKWMCVCLVPPRLWSLTMTENSFILLLLKLDTWATGTFTQAANYPYI